MTSATSLMPRIGVMGCKPSMPDAFPLSMRENSGNMIHGKAPFELFPDCLFYTDPRFGPGRANFMDYLNAECSHIIITMANSLRIGRTDGTPYVRLRNFLDKCKVPIVIFGLGAQARRQEFPDDGLPAEAIELMKYLGDRTELIGVRGDYTAAVLEHYAGVTNTFVTGCPSFFSRPFAFDLLAESLRDNRKGRPAFNVTRLGDAHESRLAAMAITEDLHWIEAANPRTTAFANRLRRGVPNPRIPDELARLAPPRGLPRGRLEDYFSRRFQLFRETSSWYAFNTDCVGFTFGTRFHGNMASLLSGVPALWVTHDARTEEFTDYLRLPAVRKEDAAELGVPELRALIDYSAMYEAIPGLFDRFNHYLDAHGLPTIPLPTAYLQQPTTTALSAARRQPGRGSSLGRRARRLGRGVRRRFRKVVDSTLTNPGTKG